MRVIHNFIVMYSFTVPSKNIGNNTIHVILSASTVVLRYTNSFLTNSCFIPSFFFTRQNFYCIKSHFIVSIFKNPVLKNLIIVSVMSDQNLILTLRNLVFTAFLKFYLFFLLL